MRTLLVLCGDGRLINGHPFITLRYPDGELIAEKTIKGIYPEDYDRILYAITEESDKQFGLGSRICDALSVRYPVEIITVQNTNGPAETAYQSILSAKVDGEIAIKDSNNYLAIPQRYRGNFVAGLDLVGYEHTIHNLRSKSFILINEQGQILDIVEKRFRSDVISCGFYGFKQAFDYIEAYKRLSDSTYPIERLYVSHIISYLIGYSNRVFHAVNTVEFEDWKTPYAWSCAQRRHGTYFLDMEKFGANKIPVRSEIMDLLRHSSKRGGKFVICIRGSGNGDEMLDYFRENGVNALAVITGCGYSEVLKMVDVEKELREIIWEDT